MSGECFKDGICKEKKRERKEKQESISTWQNTWTFFALTVEYILVFEKWMASCCGSQNRLLLPITMGMLRNTDAWASPLD